MQPPPRRPRLELLEGRALLSTATLGLGADTPAGTAIERLSSPASPADVTAFSSAPAEIAAGGGMGPVGVLMAGASGLPTPPMVVGADASESLPSAGLDEADVPEFWGLVTAFPWRIASWRMPGIGGVPWPTSGGEVVAAPVVGRPVEPVMLPSQPDLWLEGRLDPGDRIDLFGVEVGPTTRTLAISFRRLGPDGAIDPAATGPVRIWLADAQGQVVCSWVLDPAYGGLDLQMSSLYRPEPTVLYLGIEAMGAQADASESAPYGVQVTRGGSPTGAPPPMSLPGGFGGGADGGGAVPSQGGGGFGSPSDFDPMLVPDFLGELGGSRGGLASPGASGPGGFGAVLDGFGLGGVGAVSRPLPTVAAASAGGLLPAGPDVRGQAGLPVVLPGQDEAIASDPLALQTPEPSGTDAEGGAEATATQLAGPGGASGTPAVADGPDGVPAAPAGVALRSAGIGGLPMLVAGLRVAWGRPVLGPTASEPPPVPEDLVPVDAPGPADPDPLLASGPPIPRAEGGEMAPSRPRVLRTALIGAAALGVGLILPDLATDRPGHRRRRPVPLAPGWRRRS